MSDVSLSEPDVMSWVSNREERSEFFPVDFEVCVLWLIPRSERDWLKEDWNLFAVWRRLLFSSRSSSRLARVSRFSSRSLEISAPEEVFLWLKYTNEHATPLTTATPRIRAKTFV